MKRTSIRLIATMAFVLTCGYLLSGCSHSSPLNSGLPKPEPVGTAQNKTPGK